MTDSGGNVAFVAVLTSAALGPWITATATDAAGNTSEFSACLAVPGPSVSSIAPTSGPAGVATAISIEGLNFQNGATVKIGGVAATGVSVAERNGDRRLDAGSLAGNAQRRDGDQSELARRERSRPGSSPTSPTCRRTNIFHDDVEKVFRAGITAGCGAGAFCVASPVTRAQMAVFLLKAEHGSSYVPPAVHRRLRRRRVPVGVRRLDRAAVHRRHHRGLRRRQLLSGQPGAPRPDGGLPSED